MCVFMCVCVYVLVYMCVCVTVWQCMFVFVLHSERNKVVASEAW